MALVLIIFLMLLCSFVVVTAFSLLAGGVESSSDFAVSVQALSLATGGKEWYLEQLENDSDWTDEVNQSGILLGAGTFDVLINSASSSGVSFTITGKRTGASGRTVQRQLTLTAQRMPPARNFTVYWGRDTGAWLELRDSTVINGYLWSAGTTDVKSGCLVKGISYCPDTQDITGAGTFTEEKIAAPYPAMPQIDQTYYNDFISTANSSIAVYATGNDVVFSSNVTLSGGVYGYRNIETTGNITISGNGILIAGQNIELHSTNSASGTLTLSPSGGNIYFFAGRNLIVNSTQNDTNVIINGNADNQVYLYSQDSADSRLVRIRKHPATTTSIDSAVLIGERRIIVEGGARITNSTLYVSDVSDNNNYLQIRDSGTSVGIAGNPCNIISVSGRDPGLVINNGASAVGFVYHWGANTGYTLINSAVITGAVVASQYTNDRIVDSTITHSAANLPEPANGFENFISTSIGSWDDKR